MKLGSELGTCAFDEWFAIERLTGRTPVVEGRAQVPGGEIWWMRVGDGDAPPLLVLHGGPGSGHDGLIPLAALSDERPVIFYDQLGCGRSQAPSDPSIYTIQRSVEELTALRRQLDLDELALFGHSWGSILAIEYLCQGRGAGISRLVLSGAISSVPQFAAGAQSLFEEVQRSLAPRGEASADQEWLERVFGERHFCRTRPEPSHVGRSKRNLDASIAYREMNGPNEFTVTGAIRDWDRTADLGFITMPTLVTTGEHDEVTPDVTSTVQKGVANGELISFPGCSHLVFDEDPIAYLQVLRAFLR